MSLALLQTLCALSAASLEAAKVKDPIRYACADACTQAYLADKENPILVRVVAKDFDEFKNSLAGTVDILNQMGQFDGDPIECFERLVEVVRPEHRFTNGITFELRNGSAVHVVGNIGHHYKQGNVNAG